MRVKLIREYVTQCQKQFGTLLPLYAMYKIPYVLKDKKMQEDPAYEYSLELDDKFLYITVERKKTDANK